MFVIRSMVTKNPNFSGRDSPQNPYFLREYRFYIEIETEAETATTQSKIKGF